MATVTRRPLIARSSLPANHVSSLTTYRTVSGSTKRERSPDPLFDSSISIGNVKRARTATTVVAEDGRERKKAEREQQKTEFKEKYSRAFPSFVFYFDAEIVDSELITSQRQSLGAKILSLGGKIEDFFSKEITHLITNRPIPGTSSANKENIAKFKARPHGLRSPIKLRNRSTEEHGLQQECDLITKALGFGQKIWNTAKLESVVDRLVDFPTASRKPPPSTSLVPTSRPQKRTLSSLLLSERLNGTSERDPTQKRHDFHYFSRSSYFVLVEDLKQELATIVAHEYPIPKGKGAIAKPTWPVLYCHPHARGPFVEFDEKEKRRWERTQRVEAEQEKERQERKAKLIRAEALKRTAEAQQPQKVGDLRRTVSMNNFKRRLSKEDPTFPGDVVDLDAEDGDSHHSTNASGFLASGTGGGYMAASGNSVGITSTTGTTSTTGNVSNGLLPAALRGRLVQQVVTSRKFPSIKAAEKPQLKGTGTMGPPAEIPGRSNILRKSKSTNTLRLPKREEGVKPGYCESCRTKFDDFKHHIQGQKHRAFAGDDDNFLQLDYVLERVKRQTLEEVAQEKRERAQRRWAAHQLNHTTSSDEEPFYDLFRPTSPSAWLDDPYYH